jgi:hypothetical protein
MSENAPAVLHFFSPRVNGRGGIERRRLPVIPSDLGERRSGRRFRNREGQSEPVPTRSASAKTGHIKSEFLRKLKR